LLAALPTLTRIRWYRGHQVPFSCFALHGTFSAVRRASRLDFMFCAPDTFLAVPRALVPIFMFCAFGLIFCGTEGVRSYFHVLCARTHFRRYRGRRLPFSCFVPRESFWAVTRASGPIFMFCAPGHVFGGTEGVESRFHVLRS
jgi:hypothetical protein